MLLCVTVDNRDIVFLIILLNVKPRVITCYHVLSRVIACYKPVLVHNKLHVNGSMKKNLDLPNSAVIVL